MKKKIPITYFSLFFALLTALTIPKEPTERIRGTTMAFLTPVFQQLLAVKTFFNPSREGPSISSSEEIQKLRLENALLREEIVHLKNIMQHELKLLTQTELLLEQQKANLSTTSLKKRHRIELQNLLKIELQAVPARVIFRSPNSWNSSLWINVGTETNQSLGIQTIAKNSPVLAGTCVIGVIDYVGKRQSRVRLITDSGLNPSTRAVRGDVQCQLISEKIYAIIQTLKTTDIIEDPQQQENLIDHLEASSQYFSPAAEALYLAKGEIHGSSKPLWRKQRHELKGIGFNYDYADGEGPARDLRTGSPSDPQGDAIPILKSGDILVTTGMDGVFPPGLPVAEVTKVYPLKEGDYYYELDALPIAGNLDDLSLVFVIPSVGYDPEEQPNPFDWL